MKLFKKIISLILIQTFLLSNISFAGKFETTADSKNSKSTLTPQLSMELNLFEHAYNVYFQNKRSTEEIILTQGLISYPDIIENGTVVSEKTTNFKIGNNNFRVPPYLAGRVARLHITALNSNNIEFQKMGIGVGRRKATIAVVLVDLQNLNNQLFVFVQDNKAILKALDSADSEETIVLGNNAQFEAMVRQDSFLERSALGIKFLNRVLGIGESRQSNPQEVVNALSKLAMDNPKLKKDLPVNLAFFSQDYMLSFSENLVNHSHIAVLRDREQRGRFIAIVDRLNPDNRVVFERRGDQVFVLGENEQEIIPKLEKHGKAQVINFTDLEEGAKFCRNITRDLIEINFADNSNSISMRKNVQLNVGANNSDLTLLKVNQVTQSTLTGYQVKQRAPEFIDQILAIYLVYILKSDFPHDISVDGTAIDYESADYLFFNPEEIETWPDYLSFGSAENSVYYQHINGTYSSSGQDYAVYRAIGKEDYLTYLLFNNDGSFTIKGINWQDGKPVIFRNIKNIALANIVTQLSLSRFILIDPVLNKHFNTAGLETGINPIRSVYKFFDGGFEQGENIKMQEVIDFSAIQKEQDKQIEKTKKFDIKHNLAAMLFSIFSLVFMAQNLFASEPGTITATLQSPMFSESLFAGAILVVGMIIHRIFSRPQKQQLVFVDKIKFNQSRRNFISTVSISGLIGFLILQTGILAFIQIYSQLKEIMINQELRPQMAANLTMLAGIYEQMPDGFYAENKRLYFPMNVQYWQLFLNLSAEDAEKAANIYRENAIEILSLYSQPDKQLQPISAVQLLRIIAARIQGAEILIQKRQTVPLEKGNEKQNIDLKQPISAGTGLGVAAAVIAPTPPIVGMPQTGQKPKEHRSEKYETNDRMNSETENNIQPKTGNHDSISARGKLLSDNYVLLAEIDNLANEKNKTFFRLKDRVNDKEKTFVIRPISTEAEIAEFQDLLGNARNFDWKKIFNMVQGFKKLPQWADKFCLYGVFSLDEFGREQQIVAAADYIIRDINGKTVLNGGHIEVLPRIKIAYSGIGKTLSTKLVADTFIDANFKQTHGRVYFSAENKGKVDDSAGIYQNLLGKGNNLATFYKDVLGFKPNMKKNTNGQLEETNEFELSLEDTLAFMQREFMNAGFFVELEIESVINYLEQIYLKFPTDQLVEQSI